MQNRAVLAVRSDLEPSVLFPSVIRAIRSVDTEQSVYDPRSMQEIVDRSLAQRRLTTSLMVGFGGMALLLAAVGIYGVVRTASRSVFANSAFVSRSEQRDAT